MMQPNIIFCFTDQQKATSLDLYNQTFSAIHARNLQRLADRGTLFENAYCSYPLCVTSRISLMTGRYPNTSGYIGNRPLLPIEADSLQDRLKAVGYRSYLAGKDHCFAPGYVSARDNNPGVGKRYDKAFMAIHNDQQPPEIQEALPNFLPFIEQSKTCHRIWGAEIAPWTREETISHVLADKAIGFIDEHLQDSPGAPFFLHWGPPDPHEYYQVPKEYAELFPPEKITLPPNWKADLADRAEFVKFMKWFFTAGDPPPGEQDIRQLMSIYLGMCALVDDELGRLIDHVEARGLMDNTIFVFSSDHGDMCGEMGLAHKWNGLYEGMVRVPLVIAAPGKDMVKGQRVSDPVGLVDLAATLCELAGAEAPEHNQGRSLTDLLQGKGKREYVYLESGIPGRAMTTGDIKNFPDHRWDATTWKKCPYDPPHRWTGRCFGVRDKQYKIIFREGQRTELYDLKNDPWELINVIDEPSLQPVVERLKTAQIDHLLRAASNIRESIGARVIDENYTPGGDTCWHGPIHPAWEETGK